MDNDNALQHEQGYFQELLQSLPAMIIAVGQSGEIMYWNKAAENLPGFLSDKSRGAIIWEHLSFLAPYREKVSVVFEKNIPRELRMVEINTPNQIFLNIFISPLLSSSGAGAVFLLEDVTEVRRKDEYVRQAQKMDTVGNLASGLAHDFNNVIGGIKATVASIRFSLELNAPPPKLATDLEKDLKIIEDSAGHGEDMVRQLKSLARREEKEFAVIDLIDLLNRVLDMCGNILPRSVYIGRFLDSHEHAFVNAYPTQLEQAVLNLCVNASHAMTIMRPPEDATEGGTLSVSLDRVSPGRDFYKVLPGAVEGDYWVLRICDTGIGMAQDILDKIFDPFFTTKDKETGTGLGLSMVYNIIQNHKGYIEVYSEPGNGSIFNVFLPAVDNKKEGGKVADKNSATPPREAPPETKKGIFQNLGEKHRIVFR